MLSGEATNTNFIVFVSIRLGLESTIQPDLRQAREALLTDAFTTCPIQVNINTFTYKLQKQSSLSWFLDPQHSIEQRKCFTIVIKNGQSTVTVGVSVTNLKFSEYP